MDLAQLPQVADAFFEAAVDPTKWSSALDRLAQATDSAGVVAIPVKGRMPDLPLSEPMKEVAAVYLKEGWYLRDLRFRGVPHMLRCGIVVDQDFISPEEMARSPHYQDFLGPLGLQWFASLAFCAEDDIWGLTMQRSPQQGPFTPSDQNHLLRLAKSLSPAASLARRLGQGRVNGMADAFEMMGHAFALLDRSGHVVRANSRGSQLLGAAFAEVSGELVPRHRETVQSYKRHLTAALGPTLLTESDALAPVVIPREGGRPIVVRAVPLRGDGLGHFAPARAILMFNDPEDRAQPPEALIQAFLGLTRAEARLVSVLATGMTIAEAAQQLQVSQGTARSQLKSVFAKTGLSRQSALIALVTSLPGHTGRIR